MVRLEKKQSARRRGRFARISSPSVGGSTSLKQNGVGGSELDNAGGAAADGEAENPAEENVSC